MELRKTAAELVAYAESLEFKAKLEKAKQLPNGELISLLLKAELLRRTH
ncbi:MAG: hypothetical protein ACO24I_05435 [Candidatus Fonsibacter ubiquis]